MTIAWASGYRPSRDEAHRGGDFIEVAEHPDGSLLAVIGDVMGHGPEEARLAQRLAATWRALVLDGVAEDEMLPALNSALLDAAPRTRSGIPCFTTVCSVHISAQHIASVRLAGHPAPVMYTGKGAKYLDAPVGPPVGLQLPGLDPVWPPATLELPAGAVLVLYTDGLLDSYAAPDSLGIEELVAAVSQSAAEDAQAWALNLLSQVSQHASDDAGVVVLTTSP